ncbi:hypothetical protein [Kaarinaea lacus]
MKQFFLLCMASLALVVSSTVFSAEEGKSMDESSDPAMEAIIAACEKQYSAEAYTNTEERETLIEQCIDDKVAESKK